jgi:uncharacterized membrane protein YdjX (TVP38/TMEM64 family)
MFEDVIADERHFHVNVLTDQIQILMSIIINYKWSVNNLNTLYCIISNLYCKYPKIIVYFWITQCVMDFKSKF